MKKFITWLEHVFVQMHMRQFNQYMAQAKDHADAERLMKAYIERKCGC